MPTRNISLTDHFARFVEQEVATGRYQNISEVMRAGLRLLEQQTREEQEKLELLRSMSRQAFRQLDQGEGVTLKDRQQVSTRIREIGRRAHDKARQETDGK